MTFFTDDKGRKRKISNNDGKINLPSARERDLKNSKLGIGPQKTDELVDKITEIAMKEKRKNLIRNSKAGSPQYMREDTTTPLIREIPFGPDTRRIENLEHGNPKNYDIPSHGMRGFDKFEAEQNNLPKYKQFPMHEKGFRVIPHGGISIPKEQERIVRPMEKRNYEHGRLKARSNRSHQSDEDAKEIALDIMNSEKPSRFVNRESHKIRPPKPVRSDFTSIITAEKGFKGIVKKQTMLIVAEHDKPEFVEVKPLRKKHG